MTNILTLTDDMPDFTVIAQSPREMEAAQLNLIAWAERKAGLIERELREAAEQLRIAIGRKWKTTAWRSEVRKHQNRIEFYKKVKAALEAGYYIVPPFPIDIFAIRVDRSHPHRRDQISANNHDQPAQVLPQGEGRYVDPRPFVASRVQTDTKIVNHQTGETKQVPVKYHYATEYDEVDFPFKLARAEIKDTTLKAMALKIFDQIGVLPRVRKPDPIVCGQILFPNKKVYAWNPHNQNGLTFFVAWWLDTKTIKV